MREARYVSLIPRTTLHSDSEQLQPDIHHRCSHLCLHHPDHT